MGYDVIGDIHGQADKLSALLYRLGYVHQGRGWVPPQGRQALFVGDLIDRGPGQLQVLDTVRSMVDKGNARAVMGNHELNAIAWTLETKNAGGTNGYLRDHSDTKRRQHAEFLSQIGEGSALHEDLIAWFRTLPPFLDLGAVRVVHAWWHQPYVETVAAGLDGRGCLTDDFLHAAHVRHSPEWCALDGLTKGLEIELPNGQSIPDHAGVPRPDVRTQWWLDDPRTFRQVAIVNDHLRHLVPDSPLPEGYRGAPVSGSPVFIGHYWMAGRAMVQSPKVGCVDFGSAGDAALVAYRWDGEETLDNANFVVGLP